LGRHRLGHERNFRFEILDGLVILIENRIWMSLQPNFDRMIHIHQLQLFGKAGKAYLHQSP
jgi:hypothetical protein